VEKALPKAIKAVKETGAQVLWVCDPMHGNTETSSGGLKTRRFENILRELELSFQVHEANGSFLGGVHIELTGEDVTECTGGARLTDGDGASVPFDRRSAAQLRAGAGDGNAHRPPWSKRDAVRAHQGFEDGQRITINPDATLNVPDNPIVAFIEGDGIGIDITPVMLKVVNAAVEKAYRGKRRIAWTEVYAGDKASTIYGTGFPDETLTALRDFVVSIKGPLGTPVGGGMRSLNGHAAEPRSVRLRAAHPLLPRRIDPHGRRVADRHGGVPREHGRHLCRHRVAHRVAGSAQADSLPASELKVSGIRFPASSGLGIKPVSKRAASARCARPSSTPSRTIGCR
jgi:hypothetical protein